MKNIFVTKPIRLLLLLVLVPGWMSAQTISVKGTVKDAKGETLIGVSVIQKGTTNGTITDADGNYSLSVPQNTTLEFTYMGFKTKSLLAQGKTAVNVVLEEDTKTLEEVVVVGYGTQRKNDVTGAIISTDAKELREIPSANINQALQGRLAGVAIQQTSTRPGQSGQVRIRGARSLSANNDPLIILDGIPFSGTINDINPSDIKRIDVLKDASATAIYGSRGANGVILITSQRGAAGKATVAYNGFYGIKTVAEKYEVFDPAGFVKLREVSGFGYGNAYTDQEKINLERWKATGGAEGTVDWQDLLYKNGMVTNHDISISGGSETMNYSFGGGYFNETTVLPGQNFRRYALRGSLDQEIGKRFKFGAAIQNSYSVTNSESASFMYSLLTFSPFASAYNEDGSIIRKPMDPTEDSYNPLLVHETDNWSELRKRFSTFNSLYAEVKLYEGLKYRMNVGLNYYNMNYGNYFGQETPFKNGALSSAAVENEQQTQYTIENLLYYDKVFAEKHRMGLTGMFSVEEIEYQKSRMNANDLLTDYMLFYNLGYYKPETGSIDVPTSGQSHFKSGLVSYMFRANYAYDGRYMFTGSFRRDGSSRLSPANRWHNYLAFSTGWNVKNETFMDNVNWLSMLKVRAGYGETATQAINPYSTLGSLGINRYNYGSENLFGFYVNNLPNDNLGWEYSNTWNLGLDFGFLNDRITGAFELYRQHTKDLLVSQRLPPTSGVSGNIMKNVGETQNQGVELSFSASIIQAVNDGFSLDVDANISANKNKILKLNDGVDRDLTKSWFVGHSMNVIYDYKKLGIWQLDEAAEAAKYGFKPGEIKLADIGGAFDSNGNAIPDGKITEADRMILGTLDPDFEGGFTVRMGYKGFDFSAVAFYHVGGQLISTIHQPQSYLNMLQGRRNGIKVDYWTPTHPTNAYPMPDATLTQPRYGSTLGYFNGSFMKIRTITLGYTLKQDWLKQAQISSARVYFTCQNPFVLFSPYMKEGGVDPEPTGSGDQGVGGGTTIGSNQLTIGSNTPPQRNFVLGVSLQF